ncbi:methylated-DNA--[protein]-cysteine S-methyltransferase [Vibrio sp. ZSDE26]|uniref:Methylated-DNA--protein-cysteine methyltransferase n=1 Tax=Vibrio amylolyticus TaxID=2847292 RepID=A0A9X2BK50_9VIBR|nr:methylated-DNA--[protein]-cysteine S-methyltransferase [Vibrio amylolyticus]MCK6264127.1 methylated-DNA--[protein]-cysteine S-methyltransferase [Vibrio amylolyticus]
MNQLTALPRFSYYQSPLGALTLQANEHGLLGVWFPIHTTQPAQLGQRDDTFPILKETKRQLDEYFSMQRRAFSLPVASLGTDFQQQVWRALCMIPYGETWSYQQLAETIENPKAVRAVGLANGKNPVSIIVPCHRVIGKNGKLTGYAGGTEIKKNLLKLEGFLT